MRGQTATASRFWPVMECDRAVSVSSHDMPQSLYASLCAEEVAGQSLYGGHRRYLIYIQSAFGYDRLFFRRAVSQLRRKAGNADRSSAV